MQAALEELVSQHGSAALDRVVRAFEFVRGTLPTPYQHPLQRPELLFFPGLPTTPWYEPSAYPMLQSLTAELETGFARIRDEVVQLVERDEGWSNFIEGEYALKKFYPLVGKTWTARYLRETGKPVADVRAACPYTAAIVDRNEPKLCATGDVFFSMLQAGVALPPHHDFMNAKLTIHLPLIVPPDCAIVVGGEQREWVEGTCLAFDDTFLHEVWNRSDRVRVCLLFDVWHPCLTELEIAALSRLQRQFRTAVIPSSTA